ncbi:hypothetical protein Q4495_03820 [Mesomycoplasma ovipneumoniae]|nr:hypothetical protein [Mesomycoplasma ovipneumoniae]MDO6830117.1 hypothetical protein [Mesomycoplasma ovipneumoniae]
MGVFIISIKEYIICPRLSSKPALLATIENVWHGNPAIIKSKLGNLLISTLVKSPKFLPSLKNFDSIHLESYQFSYQLQ